MRKYLLLSEEYENDFFEAENDRDAEKYVEENYDEMDGEMKLYRLEHVCSWQ